MHVGSNERMKDKMNNGRFSRNIIIFYGGQLTRGAACIKRHRVKACAHRAAFFTVTITRVGAQRITGASRRGGVVIVAATSRRLASAAAFCARDISSQNIISYHHQRMLEALSYQ